MFMPWNPLLIFALIACNLLPLCFAWFKEPKALKSELFCAVLMAMVTFLVLLFAPVYEGSVRTEGVGQFLLVVSLVCGVFYALEAGVLFFLTPRHATLRTVHFALSVSFFSAVLVCGFTTFSPYVVLLHTAAVLGVVAWHIFGNSVGLIAALLIEGALFGYGFIAPPLGDAAEILRYVRFAAGILLFQLVAAHITTKSRTLLTARAALVPVYYWFVLYKAQQFGPYELLIAAAYGSCLILIAQWMKAPLLAFAGSVSLILSLAAALQQYLTVEMTAAALTSFSLLFCGLTLIYTILL